MTGTENSVEMGHRGIVYLVKLSFGVNYSSVQQLFYFPEVLVVINQKFIMKFNPFLCSSWS